MERLWSKSYILLTISMLFLFSGFYFLLPTLPLYVEQLGGDHAQVGLVAGVFTLSAVLMRLFTGVWLDRFGRRGFALLGLAGIVISMMLYNWIGGLILLVLLRILHGVFWAFSTTAVSTLVTDVIPVSRRGEGMGWYGMAMTLAMAIGPMTGTFVLGSSSFMHLFFLAAAGSFVALIIVFTVRIPFQKKSHTGQPAGKARIELVEKSLWPVTASILMLTFAYGGITAFIPLFAQSVEVNPGMFFLVYAIALTLIRPIAGRLSDKFGEASVIIPALAVVVISLLLLGWTEGFAGIFISAVLYGIGFGSAQPALQAATLRLASPDRRGGANAAFSSAFDLGIGAGSIILGWISFYFGYSVLFIACAFAVVISLIIFAKIVKRQLSVSVSE